MLHIFVAVTFAVADPGAASVTVEAGQEMVDGVSVVELDDGTRASTDLHPTWVCRFFPHICGK